MSTVVGIGSDICSLDRIEKLYVRSGYQVLSRFFTKNEALQCTVEGDEVRALAVKIAVKEAVVKAMGGLLDGMRLQEIEVLEVNNEIEVRYRGQVEQWMVSHAVAGTAVHVMFEGAHVIALLMLLDDTNNISYCREALQVSLLTA
ncbi:MAG: holo-ACP synthase [Candidatus Saccharibacteria bacterium]